MNFGGKKDYLSGKRSGNANRIVSIKPGVVRRQIDENIPNNYDIATPKQPSFMVQQTAIPPLITDVFSAETGERKKPVMLSASDKQVLQRLQTRVETMMNASAQQPQAAAYDGPVVEEVDDDSETVDGAADDVETEAEETPRQTSRPTPLMITAGATEPSETLGEEITQPPSERRRSAPTPAEIASRIASIEDIQQFMEDLEKIDMPEEEKDKVADVVMTIRREIDEEINTPMQRQEESPQMPGLIEESSQSPVSVAESESSSQTVTSRRERLKRKKRDEKISKSKNATTTVKKIKKQQ